MPGWAYRSASDTIPAVPDSVSHTLTQLGVSIERRQAVADALATGMLTELPWAEPPSVPSLSADTLLDGRYRVEGEIGRGGFGAVYRAADEATGEPVAVKLLTHVADRLVERMRREIAVLRRLSLPCVVEFLDEGDHEGQPYVVMPLVEGIPFPGEAADRSWGRVGPRVLALVEAVARVHRAGVLHRDLKPANVLWVGSHPVLIDFGLAVSDRLRVDDDGLSGSPAYLSPEQYVGDEPDARSDLYSVGVMAYEALAGRLPFPGTTLFEIIEGVLTRSPPPLRDVADVPNPVAELVHRLLARAPDDRPDDAEEVARALLPHLPALELPLDAAGPWSPQQLEGLFAGPELGHRLRSDPARVLWQRTAGQRQAVRRALGSWVRAGMASIDASGRLRMARRQVDRLLAGMVVDASRGAQPSEPLERLEREVWAWVDLLGPWATVERVAEATDAEPAQVSRAAQRLARIGLVLVDEAQLRSLRSPRAAHDQGRRHEAAARLVPPQADARVGHLLAASQVEAVPEAALAVARARLSEGAVTQAWAVAHEGLVMERRLGARDDELLLHATHIALQGGHRRWLAAVAREASRRSRPAVAQLAELAARSLHAHVELDELRALDLSAYPSLQLWRLRLAAHAAQRADHDTHARFLDEVEPPADDDDADRRLHWLRWQARLWLRQERPRDAAEVTVRAYEAASTRYDRVSLTLNAAELYQEAGAFDEAASFLHRLDHDMEGLRVPLFELLAVHLASTLAYRQGVPHSLPDEYEEAIEQLASPAFTASWRFNLAARAWREGDLSRARAAIAAVTAAWEGIDLYWSVARSFQAMLGGHEWGDDDLERVRRALGTGGPAGLVAQAMVCARRSGVELVSEAWPDLRARLVRMQYPPAARRELLSLEEMDAAMEATTWSSRSTGAPGSSA